MSYYNEYAVVPTQTPKTEQYHTLNQIPRPIHLGFNGYSCSSDLNCHTDLLCQQNKCGEYIPNIAIQPPTKSKVIKERFQGVPGVDFFQMSPDYEDFPITTRASPTLEYTSKYKSRSGRNYW